MADYIPLSVPNLKGNELKYVTEAVGQEWVSTAGPFVGRFEEAVAALVGAPEAVACQSGTAGLHLALMEGGVGHGDIVLVPTLTFVAAVNPVTYVGATPVFMDCDDSLCMDAEKLRDYCEQECDFKDGALYEKASGQRVRAVIPVHVFGSMADMDAIMQTAGRYDLFVIEDATEALCSRVTAGRYAGKYAGTIGDIGVYSFNGNKIMTTGGGGMIVARDAAQLAHMRKLSIQAKKSESDHLYEHDEIGYNYRMTNIQAALGVAQAEQMRRFVETKKRNYDLYRELGLDLLSFSADVEPNYWFYSLLTDGNWRFVMEELEKRDIGSRPVWMLIHTLKPYEGARAYRIEKAYYYRDRVLNIPCSTNLSRDDVRRVAAAVHEIMGSPPNGREK